MTEIDLRRGDFEAMHPKAKLFGFDEDKKLYIGDDVESINFQWTTWCACIGMLSLDVKEAKAQAVPKWISVKDKLPGEKQWVLIRVACSDYFNVEQGMYRGDERWMNCWCANRHNDLYPVTHWMPLPESPQEQAND